MSARYHFSDCDKGRAVGRSAASQRASTVAAATDLNPIEHAWDALVRRIAQKTISLRTEQEHKITFRKEW
ncbi:hypothetical protein TNCV_3790811 [Trichonephila clavipes]|nr:hypothetical protein TNCV_3790811 [Trichonephila clavipes]